jgi:hypothetical protein
MLRALVRSLSTEATKATKAPFVLEVTAIPTQLAIEKGFATWFNHHVQQVRENIIEMLMKFKKKKKKKNSF